MKPVTLLLGIHNHQPVGNFDHVFRLAYDRCYRPFLDVLEAHPSMRMALHYTGPLLDWFEKEEPAFLDRLVKLVASRQVEMLGGGYYEPILAVLPDRDALGQVNLLSQRLRKRLRAEPKGFWLAERVWDGGLPKKVAQTGLRYTIVDDSHFMHAGWDADALSGYYLSEREGHTLGLFPISKDLRYLIPFRLPEELIGFLQKLRQRGGGVVTYADDGEKFGLWPGTHKWVFEERYLDRLFTALEENADWLELMTFSDHLEAHPPAGRVYLPSASYDEMMEWALPTEASKALHDRREELEKEGRLPAFRSFLRGGFWDGFLLKYPESNHLHKRMLDVSQRAADAAQAGAVPFEVTNLVWRAQGNDVYWHGLFGGLYLSNLRHETYRNLITAENRLEAAAHGREWIHTRVLDLNKDGVDEVVISTKTLGLVLAPAYGGGLLELDYRPCAFNLSNVLGRREEAYHRDLTKTQAEQDQAGGPPKSIHDQVKVKEAGLERVLVYDRHRRLSFLDRFLAPDSSLEDFDRIDDAERGTCVEGKYEMAAKQPAKRAGALLLPMTFQGEAELEGRTFPIALKKEYRVMEKEAVIAAAYRLENVGKASCRLRFGVELNLTLLAGDDPQRYYEWAGSGRPRMRERGCVAAIDKFSLVDAWHGFRVTLCLDRAGDVWYIPIETVSQSEEGFERIYQGSALLASWVLTLNPGEGEHFDVKLEINEL